MKTFTTILTAAVVLTFASMSLAGPVLGPGVSTKIVPAHSSNWYNEAFVGGQLATVSIVGDGDTDVDIFVYDANGRLVAQAIGLTDREACSFVPPFNQTYRIEVRNLGGVWNRVTLRTY